jgi:hypothetical protein
MDAGLQMSLTPISAGLTERDFEPVKDLIEEVRRREQSEGLAKAVVTWQNAFTIFKKLERRLGLPKSQRELVVYQAIVSDLRSVGYWLLDCTYDTPVDLASFGVGVASLKACLLELEIDDEIGSLAENAPVLAKLEQYFG